MFEKILVALDGSPLAERVLGSLETLLLRPNAELLLVRVVADAEPGREDEAREAALAYVRALEARLAARGFRAGGHVLVGADPAAEIVAFAAQQGASLVCLGTHGRTGLKRLALGSVAERVLRAVDRPLLLVNPWVPPVPLAFKRVVVPLDGSERSEESLPVAAELARHEGAEIILVHVEDVAALDSALAVAEERRRSVTTLERAERSLAESGAKRVRSVTRAGFAVGELVAAIRDAAPDAVLMTTHGRTGLARLAFGSVTEGVLRRSPVPLLVLRSVPALAEKKQARVASR